MKEQNTHSAAHEEAAVIQSPKKMSPFSVYIRGILMGSADVVPGVSGGTVALIVGIYERLVGAIAAITKEALPAWKNGGVRGVWKAIDGTFLVVLGLGVITSFLTLANAITWALEDYPQLLWSFFFGLVAASCVFIGRMVRQWTIGAGLAFVVATIVTFIVTSATPATTPDALWFIFLSGMIAISAMILPGISGSFILVLLGKYAYMLEALRGLDLVVIIVFVAGCAIGIMTASRMIHWLFERFHDLALAIIVGIMLGSLNKIWPWKETLEWRMSSDGHQEPIVQKNVWPTDYAERVGEEPYLLGAIVLMLVGAALIVLVERLGSKKEAVQEVE